MEHPYGEQYGQEGNPRAYMTMRDYRNLPYQWQQPIERNPNPNMSLREYRDQWMSAHVYHVPSTYPPPPQYDYPEPPFYASTPQSPQSPQPPQSIHPLLEQAILDLTRKVNDFVEENKKIKARSIVTVKDNLNKKIDGLKDDFEHKRDNLQDSIEDLIDQQQCPPEEDCQSDIMVEEQRVVTVQANQETETVESSLDKELDGFQSEIDQKLDIQQESILKLTNQPVQQEEESPKEECLNGTIVEESCLQQPQQGLVENSESSDIGVVVCLWEKKDAIPLLLTEEAVEEHKENNLPLPPTDSVYIMPSPAPQSQPKTPTANAQATYYPLPVAPSDDQVYILPTPAKRSKPAAHAPKGKSNPLHAMQNIRRLVASVHAFATTSKTMATAYIAWHSGWFGCGFGFGTPGPSACNINKIPLRLPQLNQRHWNAPKALE